jgi:hypothetical protein
MKCLFFIIFLTPRHTNLDTFGEIRIKNKVIKLHKYCLKNESNSVSITHAQNPTIKKPNRTSTMHEGEEL